MALLSYSRTAPTASKCRRTTRQPVNRGQRVDAVVLAVSKQPEPAKSDGEGQVYQTDKVLGDWRTHRAKLVAIERSGQFGSGCAYDHRRVVFASGYWAHAIPQVEVGCLLVAKHNTLGFFQRTVVLMVRHDAALGSVGLVLNKPSPLCLGEASIGCSVPALKDMFAQQPLYYGGPVCTEVLSVVHRHDTYSHADAIGQGICYSQMSQSARMLLDGVAKPQDFRLMLGFAGWAPRQLEAEVESGCWHVVSASRDVVLPSTKHGLENCGEEHWRRVRRLIGADQP